MRDGRNGTSPNGLLVVTPYREHPIPMSVNLFFSLSRKVRLWGGSTNCPSRSHQFGEGKVYFFRNCIRQSGIVKKLVNHLFMDLPREISVALPSPLPFTTILSTRRKGVGGR